MGRPKIHEDRKEYQREWQFKRNRQNAMPDRVKKFKVLLADILEYEQQGMTYQEIAVELASNYKYRLTVKEN